jgi:ribosomal-protein-alanine N-acetyltransferase
MLVRRAREGDLAALADLGLASWQRGIGPHVLPSVREAVRRHNPFVAFLRERGGKVLVVEIDGTAAGLAAREADDAHLSDLWVAPRFEGRGVGSALLRAVEREVARAGFEAITLEVLTANVRAASFYRRWG